MESQMTASKSDIIGASEEIKQLVDKHAQTLLNDLKTINIHNESKLDSASLKLRQHMDAIKCVERHIQQLEKYGSSGDICSSVDAITTRCVQLEESHRVVNRDWNLDLDAFQLEKSLFLELCNVVGENILGRINKKGYALGCIWSSIFKAYFAILC